MTIKNGSSNILQLDLFRKNKFHDDAEKAAAKKSVEYFHKYFTVEKKSNVSELRLKKHDVPT